MLGKVLNSIQDTLGADRDSTLSENDIDNDAAGVRG